MESEKLKRQLKTQYSEAWKFCTEKSYSNSESIEDKLKIILEITTKTIGVSEPSYWEYHPECVDCILSYELKKDNFSLLNGQKLTKKIIQIIFYTIENKTQVVASKMYIIIVLAELCKDYIPNNDIQSFTR
jgi:hypothetical protein